MEVLVEFDRSYGGPPSEAVWLIATPKNRLWFEQHAGSIDINSAIFDENVVPLTVIWQILDHHPEWNEIVVRGTPLTVDLEQGIQPNAVVASRGIGEFRLRRP